jgi:DnaJ-domain-containing protein 1
MLKEFAATDPNNLIRQGHSTGASEEPADGSTDKVDQLRCFSVLGVSPSATLDQVKQAYKLQVKQNHPDRVHGLAPIFKTVAEAETKKLNAAYAEALVVLGHG